MSLHSNKQANVKVHVWLSVCLCICVRACVCNAARTTTPASQETEMCKICSKLVGIWFFFLYSFSSRFVCFSLPTNTWKNNTKARLHTLLHGKNGGWPAKVKHLLGRENKHSVCKDVEFHFQFLTFVFFYTFWIIFGSFLV